MDRRKRWLFVLALLGYLSWCLPACSQVRTRQTWALLIGVNCYQPQSGLKNLLFCQRDMEALRECLITLGVPRDNICLLANTAGENQASASNANNPDLSVPSYSNIRDSISSWLRKAGKEDLVLIAFSGHGQFINGRTYLCPCDADRNRPEETMIAIDWLYAKLAAADVAQRLLVIDACRNTLSGETPRGLAQENSTEVLQGLEGAVPQGILVFTSCARGQQAWELPDLQHGIFSFYVVHGLKGAADVEVQGNRDGRVSSLELFEYVSQKTALTARQAVSVEQTPQFFGQGQSFVIADVGAYLGVSIRSQATGQPVRKALVTLLRQPPGSSRLMEISRQETDEGGLVGFRLTPPDQAESYMVRVEYDRRFLQRRLATLSQSQFLEFLLPIPPPEREKRLTWRLPGTRGLPRTVAFSPDGQWLAVGLSDGSVALWDWRRPAVKAILQGHEGEVTGIDFTPDSEYLVSGGRDAGVCLWSLSDLSRGPVLSYSGHTDEVTAVAVHPDGIQVAGASRDGSVILWDLKTGQQLGTLRGHEGPVLAVAFTPDGRRLATGGGDRKIILWQVGQAKPEAELTGFPNMVTSLAFGNEGVSLAAAYLSNTAQLWDIESGKLVQSFTGHLHSVVQLCFQPGQPVLATASYDKTVRLWDARTGLSQGVFLGHTMGIQTLAFSPDGQWLASGATDATVRLWSVSDQKEIAVFITLFDPPGWLAIQPQGFYDGSEEPCQLLVLIDPETRTPLTPDAKQQFHKAAFLSWGPLSEADLPPGPLVEPARR